MGTKFSDFVHLTGIKFISIPFNLIVNFSFYNNYTLLFSWLVTSPSQGLFSTKFSDFEIKRDNLFQLQYTVTEIEESIYSSKKHTCHCSRLFCA